MKTNEQILREAIEAFLRGGDYRLLHEALEATCPS